MTIKSYSFFLPFILFAFSLHAQISNNSTVYYPATESYMLAEEAMLHGNYKKAIRHFEKSLKEKPGLSAAHRGIGFCYASLNDHENAIIHYEIVLESDSLFSRAIYYELGDAYYKIGRVKKALSLFEEFTDLQDVDDAKFGMHGEREGNKEESYLENLSNSLQSCYMMLDSINFGKVNNFERLGPGVNSGDDEYFPFVSNNQKMLFFTKRYGKNKDEDLFYAKSDDGHNWKHRSEFKYFNTPVPEGRFTMVRDGKKMFFSACNREGVLGPCDIWEGTIEENEITAIKPVEGFLNTMGYETQVTVSCDGSQLFFVADGGKGDLKNIDIWYSVKQPDGQWKEPEKLGPNINTNGDEQSPFLTNDGKTLYFSSNGKLGIGGSDIYMSRKDEVTGTWGPAVNLGQPINSPNDEIGFFLCADGVNGYVASDRPNGFNSGFNYDIYKFTLNEKLINDPITFVEGYVKDSIVGVQLPATVHIEGRDSLRTDDKGRFFLCVPANSKLKISVDLNEYDYYERTFNIPKWDNKELYGLEILLNHQYLVGFAEADTTAKDGEHTFFEEEKNKMNKKKKKATIRGATIKTEQFTHTVFFNFDSDNLSPMEKEKISKFIIPVDKGKVTRVEIIGYADDVGPDNYNLKLSEDRAKNIAIFLMENSLKVDQIYLEGKGEIKDDKPKPKNRKVDIKIYTQEKKKM